MNWGKINAALKDNRVQWALLLSFVTIAFFVNLGADGLFSAQEGRSGVLTRNLLHSNNWLSVDFPGAAENEKPIFSYWLYAISAWCFGLNEFAFRLPGVIAALLTVVMTVHLAGKIFGRDCAFLAGYILCTMATFLTLARTVRIDIILTAFYMLQMLLLYYGYFQKRKATGWLYVFYAVTGFSMIVKGPVSAVIPAFMIVLYAVVFRQWRMLWEMKPISGVLIVILIGSPWFIYESVRTHGKFAFEFFIYHNLERFVGGSDLKDGKHAPLYFYLGKFFAGTLPWSLAVPFALWQCRRKWRSLRPETYYLIIWIASVFIFFSLAAIKRGDYILLLYPAVAILLARYFEKLNAANLKLTGKWVYGWSVLVGLVVIATVLFISGAIYKLGFKATGNDVPHLCVRDGQSMMQVSDLVNGHLPGFLIIMAVILTFLFFVGKVLAQGKIYQALAWFLPGMLLLLVLFFQFLQPVLDVFNTNKPFCAKVRELVPYDKTIVYVDDYDAEVVFYTDRNYIIAKEERIAPAIAANDYLLMFGKHYRKNFSKQPVNNDFELIATSPEGHNSPMILLRRKSK